jgi:DNA (cytosine-5)-methyltransferase 1
LSMGCTLLFMENVSAIVNRGMSDVLRALAESGFAAEWMCLRASDVGASHKRERWFCIAYRPVADSADAEGRRDESQRKSDRRGVVGWSGEALVDTGSQRPGEPGESEVNRPIESPGRADQSSRRRADVADAQHPDAGLREPGAPEATPADRRHGSPIAGAGVGLFAPGPADARWGDILRNAPWLAPAIEPGFHVLVDGCPMVVDESRADQLRCCGNGVVVAQAAVAYAHLLGLILGDR